MVDHSAREHAQWSASATDRNWNCSGALALTQDLPETTNEAADWGTACHQIAEKCLRHGQQAGEFIGTTEKGKKHSFEVDEEMADTAQMYVDYVRQRAIAAAPPKVNPASLLQIEQRFSLASLKPPFEAGGTSDAMVYFPLEYMIEVVDLKGGRGVVVDARKNPQARTYGVGSLLANPGRKIEWVRSTIVQPRASLALKDDEWLVQPDGSFKSVDGLSWVSKDRKIRSETIHISDLIEWTTELMDAMERAQEAFEEYKFAGMTSIMSRAEWSAKHLNAGDHCKFCKAAGFCPALEQKALDAAGVWFDDLDQPRLSNSPDMLSPERAAALLDAADMINDFVNAVRAYWHGQAEAGVEIPNYVLVDKEGREKWNEGAEAEAAAIAKGAGLVDAKLFNAPKIRTPKQVRTELTKLKKADAVALLTELSATPKTGTNLVRATNTTRPAVTPAAHKHFDIHE